jgi:hypothetical protein
LPLRVDDVARRDATRVRVAAWRLAAATARDAEIIVLVILFVSVIELCAEDICDWLLAMHDKSAKGRQWKQEVRRIRHESGKSEEDDGGAGENTARQ